MTTVNPYLTFNGTCEEAFNFYKSVFGGYIPYMGRYKDMPPVEGKSAPANEGEKIMHTSLPISKETMLMGSDSSEAFGKATTIGKKHFPLSSCRHGRTGEKNFQRAFSRRKNYNAFE